MSQAHENASSERIRRLVDRARERQASDLHLDPVEGAALRVFTKIERLPDTIVEAGEIAAFLDDTFDKLARARLEKLGMADSSYADGRLGAIRIHASRGRLGPRLAIRLLSHSVPELEALQLPDVVATLSEVRSGMILISGPPGNGKTTTIVSLLARICARSALHVMTLESPIEHVLRWQRSIVSQYEVGRDVSSFAEGVRGALRADPNVLFIGELRELETVTACLQAAESGHMVFAALHAPSETPQAVNRLVGLFPSNEQERARWRIAESLRALVGLRLLPARDGSGLRPAAEIMLGTEAVRRLIRDGSIHMVRTTIASSRREGMQLLETALSDLVAEGAVDLATARAASHYPDEVREAPVALRRR